MFSKTQQGEFSLNNNENGQLAQSLTFLRRHCHLTLRCLHHHHHHRRHLRHRRRLRSRLAVVSSWSDTTAKHKNAWTQR